MKNRGLFFVFLLLAGCHERVADIGTIDSSPSLSRIQNPYEVGFEAVDLPVDIKDQPKKEVGSLWRSGAQTFFKDQRASKKGDLVLVKINLKNDATWKDSFNSTKNTEMISSVNDFIRQFNPKTNSSGQTIFDPSHVLKAVSKPKHTSNGEMKHNFSVQINMPAIVVQVLPNGLMVLFGSREMRFSKSKERLVLMGVANQSDISANNVIDFERLAESRLLRYGQGDMENAVKTPLLYKAVMQVWPF
jgi:flagellar L-ring protein precursor FlgH